MISQVNGIAGDGGAARGEFSASSKAVSKPEPNLRPRPGKAATSPRPAPAECGALPFVIKRDGTWLYKGTAIGRKELVCLFASVLRRETDGTFWLETPAERGTIEVEDAPFVVVEMDWSGSDSEQVVTFRTNTDEIVSVGIDHPLRFTDSSGGGDPKPYVLLRQGAGSHPIEARISRPVFYELAALAEPQPVRRTRCGWRPTARWTRRTRRSACCACTPQARRMRCWRGSRTICSTSAPTCACPGRPGARLRGVRRPGVAAGGGDRGDERGAAAAR